MRYLLENENLEPNIKISIDQILLCIIYSIYKKNGYSILFANIVNNYEKSCEIKIDREILLNFYN
jgi:hypothetical protein